MQKQKSRTKVFPLHTRSVVKTRTSSNLFGYDRELTDLAKAIVTLSLPRACFTGGLRLRGSFFRALIPAGGGSPALPTVAVVGLSFWPSSFQGLGLGL